MGNAWIAYGQRLDRMGNAWISTFARLSLFLNAWGMPGDAWGTPGDVWEAPGMCNSKYSPCMGRAWGRLDFCRIVVLCYFAKIVEKFSKFFMTILGLSQLAMHGGRLAMHGERLACVTLNIHHAWGAHGDAWIVVLCYLAVLVAKFSKYFMSFVRLSKFLNA